MKKFLIVEQNTHNEEVHHVIEADTFEEALKTFSDDTGHDEFIEESLAMSYTCEAFPPTRNGKPLLKYQHYLPDIITVYEIVGHLDDFKDKLNSYTSDVFDKAMAVEKARREARRKS